MSSSKKKFDWRSILYPALMAASFFDLGATYIGVSFQGIGMEMNPIARALWAFHPWALAVWLGISVLFTIYAAEFFSTWKWAGKHGNFFSKFLVFGMVVFHFFGGLTWWKP